MPSQQHVSPHFAPHVMLQPENGQITGELHEHF